MPRGACMFRQSDLAKALKAAKQAGVPVARYEIDRDGKIVVVAGKEPKKDIEPAQDNDFGG